jgi:hypothetical protein
MLKNTLTSIGLIALAAAPNCTHIGQNIDSTRKYIADTIAPKEWYCFPEDTKERDKEIMEKLMPLVKTLIDGYKIGNGLTINNTLEYRGIKFKFEFRVHATDKYYYLDYLIDGERCEGKFRWQRSEKINK